MRIFVLSISVLMATLSLPGMAQSPGISSETAKLQAFYEDYLNRAIRNTTWVQARQNLQATQFTQVFQAWLGLHTALCERTAPNEICRWGDDADPLLSAQDYDDALNFANSGFQIRHLPGSNPSSTFVLEVSFNLMPSRVPLEPQSQRTIRFVYRAEGSEWRIDDIQNVEQGSVLSTVEWLANGIRSMTSGK